MSNSLAPNLKKITVPTGKLLLDPNNPRLVTRDEDLNDEDDFMDSVLQDTTASRLRDASGDDAYRIKELERSIRQNGWLPVDFIFVRKHRDGKHYIVLEGNRRVAAIRNILKDDAADPALRESVKTLEVMEIIDTLPPAELRRKISYLLGVRHHGSLKRWTPFAQAHNIYGRYLELSGQDWDSFRWDPEIGQRIADALSIPRDKVEDRLRVYRPMCQIGNSPEVRNSKGGMKDRYFSVCEEALLGRNSKLHEYLPQEPSAFLLDETGIRRFNNLCQFSEPNRDKAPIQNPQEWRKFESILREEDTERKAQMLRDVEEDKRLPSDVWAERAVELQTLQWDKWLLKVNSILKTVTLADDLSSDEAKATGTRLIRLIAELDERDHEGGKDA